MQNVLNINVHNSAFVIYGIKYRVDLLVNW